MLLSLYARKFCCLGRLPLKKDTLTSIIMWGRLHLILLLAVGCLATEDDPYEREISLEEFAKLMEVPDENGSSYNLDDFITDNITLTGNVTLRRPMNDTHKMISCRYAELTNTSIYERRNFTVELVNASRLLEILTPDPKITNRDAEANCSVILFYSKYCPFSTHAAPHFNALIKQYPYIKMAAIDVIKYSRVNTQYGIVGVPSIILFHNGRAAAKFESPEHSLQSFAKFVHTFTGIEPVDGEKFNYFFEDLLGPVSPNVLEEIDYNLILAWGFIIAYFLYVLSGTRLWKTVVETVKNSWREAEAQHEHAE